MILGPDRTGPLPTLSGSIFVLVRPNFVGAFHRDCARAHETCGWGFCMVCASHSCSHRRYCGAFAGHQVYFFQIFHCVISSRRDSNFAAHHR